MTKTNWRHNFHNSKMGEAAPISYAKWKSTCTIKRAESVPFSPQLHLTLLPMLLQIRRLPAHTTKYYVGTSKLLIYIILCICALTHWSLHNNFNSGCGFTYYIGKVMEKSYLVLVKCWNLVLGPKCKSLF